MLGENDVLCVQNVAVIYSKHMLILKLEMHTDGRRSLKFRDGARC